ncbi:unnamed protein product [Auanema sp. JU1783]|nr:unnamed protein product [Auanema sp. JU1783]
MTTEQRTEAILFWLNKFGDQPGLNLRPCTQLITVWCSHLPSITHFCLTGKLVRRTAFSPKDAYKEAKEMLGKAFNVRKTHKHLVKQLSSSQAANGDEKEIYKFLVLITFNIAICHEDMICKFRHDLRNKGLEDILGRTLQQCCDNILGDSWFSVEMTPILQRKNLSARKTREEVYTNVSSSCDLNNTLSSPSFQKLRQKNIVIEKLEQENNVLRNQCENNVKKVNSYKEYLEEAEQQKENVSSELRSRINELNSDEKRLRMENKILLREKSCLEYDISTKEQAILDMSRELKELKSSLNESKDEVQRFQQINSKLRESSDSMEMTMKSMRKQLDEARDTVLSQQIF